LIILKPSGLPLLSPLHVILPEPQGLISLMLSIDESSSPAPTLPSRNVLHVSRTPLVGAPGRVSKALNLHAPGYTSRWFYCEDYPDERAEKFVRYGTLFQNEPQTLKVFKRLLRQADVIHVHNRLLRNVIRTIQEDARPECRYVYQVRSPLREPPLFMEAHGSMGLPFEALCCSAQYHTRHYPEFIPLPLLDLNEPSITLLKEGERPRVCFKPSHTRSSTGKRWNAKHSDALTHALQTLEGEGLIELVSPEQPVSGVRMHALRSTCHISIDEIVTGAFHTVSLEGLATGNVVINNSDYFSDAAMASLTTDGSFPPFFNVNESNVLERLRYLVENPDVLRQYQTASHDYFKRHLQASQQIAWYTRCYDALFDASVQSEVCVPGIS
jgi:hypothetical protein